MASKQKRKTTPRKTVPAKVSAAKAKKEAADTEEESAVQQEIAEIKKDVTEKKSEEKQQSKDDTESEAKENGKEDDGETTKEDEMETGDTDHDNPGDEENDEDEEKEEEAEEEEPEVDEDGNVVEINDDDDEDEDVIIVEDAGKGKEKKEEKKKDEKEASWVDIIEREKDGKLHAELSKIRKLITAGQKGKEIQDLARTHRVHMYPVYPEDLVDPFIMEIMRNCTQTKITFCCRKTDDGNKKFCGFMELSFVRLKYLEENKEKLTTIRDDIKFKIGAHRTAVDDFTNDWITAAGLPENADTNNKLTLFAPSLPPSVTVEEMWELFGRAREIWLVPGEPRQHAYIKFANEDLLQATLKDLKERGPPRPDFNFCRLVRFYDVQRVIRTQGGLRHRRDSGPLGRRGSSGILSNRSRDPSRGNRRSPPSRPKAASSSSKDDKAESSSGKTSDADKTRSSEKSSSDKAKSEAKSSSDREHKRSRSKDRDAKGRDRVRARSPRDRDRDRDRRNPVPSRSADRMRPGDRQRRPGDRPVSRFHDDRMGSILGEPPVPSLMGPPMMNNSSLERSLNQLQMPIPQPQMPMQQPPQMPMRREEVPQPGLQVLDSLLSTLGQLSHRGDNPIETLAHALHSPQGYNDPPQRDRDERGYGAGGMTRRDERRARSPLKRPVSPIDSSPMGDLDMKRRRDNRPVPDAPRDVPRDFPRSVPRDFNAGARGAGGIGDPTYKPAPQRQAVDTVSPARRVEYGGDYARRAPAATSAAPSRGFDSAGPRDNVDSYDGSSRVPRTATYEERHAQATGEIARMESEYARLMDQLGQQQSNTQRSSAAAFGRSSYY